MGKSHSQAASDVVQVLETNPQTGLTTQQAIERIAKYGPNKLVEERNIHFLDILREEITEPMILILITLGLLYSIWGSITDALTIITIVVILVLIEVLNEFRAKQSISALKKLAPLTTEVLRNGHLIEIQSTSIVEGDILLLSSGEIVPADARLLEVAGLEVDESALTGESLPVTKESMLVLPLEAGISDQKNMVFAGTIIIKGRAQAIVTATGLETELGKVVGITKATKEPKTPLQIGMKQLSKTLILISLFFSILIPILSYLRGIQPSPQQAILYGLSLAFAVIPEELPIIITMVLGVGAFALSRKNAIVKRLRAAETLGNTTIIATDKTGTLTENKMHVKSLFFDYKITQKEDFNQNEKEALKTALTASDTIKDAPLNKELTNPMAQAILDILKEKGENLQQIQQQWVLKYEQSFDNQRRIASYIYQRGNSLIILASGAPEEILANSTKILIQGQEKAITEEIQKQLATAVLEMASTGQRLLAFGYRRIISTQEKEQNQEQNLVLVGIVGFIDPPRKEVKNAIHDCQEAGIKVVMVTGDHPETARTIASQVGIRSAKVLTGNEIAKMSDDELKSALRETFIFARTTPEEKLRLVRLMRENGEIVAVTGDGINDAPALKEAHIGVVMGIRGTDVAKEVADIILTDDNFATIATAVREGRKIFANLKKGIKYYLACKLALVGSFLLSIVLGVPLPFAPIQIIVLELFMDLAASATFVAEPEESGIMKNPPINPNEKLLNHSLMKALILGALSLFAAVSITYLLTWYQTQNLSLSQTMAFAAWMIGHIFLAFNFRSEKEPLEKLGLLTNKLMLLWAVVTAFTLVAVINLPFLNSALKTTSLSVLDWLTVLGVCYITIFWMEFQKLLR
jgi:P-type Ca2+ transporter type 2C